MVKPLACSTCTLKFSRTNPRNMVTNTYWPIHRKMMKKIAKTKTCPISHIRHISGLCTQRSGLTSPSTPSLHAADMLCFTCAIVRVCVCVCVCV